MGSTQSASLIELGIPKDHCEMLVEAAQWFEQSGGTPSARYWHCIDATVQQRQRDEFFVAAACALLGALLVARDASDDGWNVAYGAAYLFETKALAQSVRSVELLCEAKCYSDALAVVRVLHSRVQRLVLFSMGPHLFNEWLLKPSARRFRDAAIRDELATHELSVFPHLYHWYSDVVHGRAEGMAETGLFERGLFSAVSPVEQMVLVSAKLLLGVAGFMIPSVLLVNSQIREKPVDSMAEAVLELYEALLQGLLHPARFEHLWTTIPQDRHWPKPDRAGVMNVDWFDYFGFQDRLREVHSSPLSRRLSEAYAPAG